MTTKNKLAEEYANNSGWECAEHTTIKEGFIIGYELGYSAAEERAKVLESERDNLFLELGKYADIPTFEYWKDKHDRLEEDNKRLREALVLAAAVSRAFGFRLSHDDENPLLAEFHEDGMLNGDKFANYLDALKGGE